ncbi:MAG: hypothetical protein JOS17DRAFT_777979 [Linnemannia elongata]|nr:MAG: hypothetical protein JOS17DRAFT_777979 [Linnemannia elongata]
MLGAASAASTIPIPVRNSIHLAKHEGYKLSRPTEFFEQYGLYVLGMLRILKHCLAVAAVAAPVAALADSGLKDIMDGEDNTMIKDLLALEGADLRRPDTFLRNNDQDKILGNLYRITTDLGHVKWVCFENYKETYRQTGLSSFVQISKSNVKALKLDLQDDHTSSATIASLRPDGLVNDPRPRKEIVYYTPTNGVWGFTKTVRQSGTVLEVLVFYPCYAYGVGSADICSEDPSPIPLLGGREGPPAEPLSNVPHLSAPIHLDFSMPLTPPSHQYLSNVLPRLDLVHFGCNKDAHELLQHCNLASLKSFSIIDAEDTNLKRFLDTESDETANPTWDRLKRLYIRYVDSDTKVPIHFLQSAQLTRLYLNEIDSTSLETVLEAVNLSKLQEIPICRCPYYPSAEKAIANRTNECTESFVVRLDKYSDQYYLRQGGKRRTAVGSPETLPLHRVIKIGFIDTDEHHYRFLRHVLPVYSY